MFILSFLKSANSLRVIFRMTGTYVTLSEVRKEIESLYIGHFYFYYPSWLHGHHGVVVLFNYIHSVRFLSS
jgi:hypothetical protein